MANKFWTEDKLLFISNNIHKGYEYLSEYFGVTVIALKIAIKRMGLKLKQSLVKHDFFSEQDLLRELRKLEPGLTRDILTSFRKLPTVKCHKLLKKSTPLYTEKSYLWLKDFFSKYSMCKHFIKSLKPEYMKMVKKWVKESKSVKNALGIKSLPGIQTTFIPKENIDFILDLFTNYVTVKKLGQLTYYTVSGIHAILSRKIPKDSTIFFAGKRWINKKEILNIRANKYLIST